MATLIVMPKQGNTVESCILTKWLIKEGEAVKAGEPLFAYETDKSAFEEAAPADGTLLKQLREEGDDVPVMEGVCVIGQPGEDISEFLKAMPQPEKMTEAPVAAGQPAADVPEPTSAPAAATMTTGEFKVSPRARYLAESMGLHAADALPTGPDGRVIERDIWALANGVKRTSGQEAPTGGYEDIKLTNIRRRIAESMHQSLSEMAQLTHHSSANATAIQAYRAKAKAMAASGGANITLNDMILFVVSRVLMQHKDINGHFLGDRLRRYQDVHLGIAVDTDRGLMVPTLFQANRMSLEEISRRSKELAERCRNGAISPDMLSGGTFTVSNLGVLGVELFTPVINPPQIGILGVCAILDRPRRAAGGGIELYPALGLSLTYDHRAVDGAPASRFLQDLCRVLADFETFLAQNQEA